MKTYFRNQDVIRTKFQLFNAFVAGDAVVICKRNMIIQSIERESGSGHHFNVYGIDSAGNKVCQYFETID